MTDAPAPEPPPPLRDFLLYFLRLGTFGFGGPIALAGAMQKDLVERRGWISKEDYLEGLALAQLSPGPLAAQLAMYLGWVRAGRLGATLVAGAFILPSLVMVLALSAAYVRFGGLPWMQAAFYGVGAAVIALVARSALKLARTTVGRDPVLLALLLVSGVITAATETEHLWVFAACGAIAFAAHERRSGATMASFAVPALPAALTGVVAAVSDAGRGELWRLALYFTEAGAFVFGSGLAIVPFLHGGVVDDYHWLNERQFLDAVAVAMLTPGPVVITVAFIGYLVAGLAGALVAAGGVFLPPYLVVIALAPSMRRWSRDPRVKAFVSGVTSAAAGAIGGAVVVLARRSLVDAPTVLIALATLAVLLRVKKAPEPLVIAAAGVVGLLLRRVT